MFKPFITILLLALTLSATAQTGARIPFAYEVGAEAMPEDIAPIHAPFDMPQLRRNTFPNRTVTVKLKKADLKNIAPRVQQAIDQLSQQGGGTVVLPQGEFATGRIELKSNVCLNVPEGTTLRFSGSVSDYMPPVFTRSAGIEGMSTGALIYAFRQHNIGLTGKGRLIGPEMDSELRKRGVNYGNYEKYIDLNTPATERIFDGEDGRILYSPTFVGPVSCSQVLIEGVSLERSPFWNIVPTYCDSVIIRGVSVESEHPHIVSGDGIDIESSRNVLIEYTTLTCGDDAFTIKAGRGLDGITVNRPTENVVIRYCLARTSIGGIAFGSETAGVIRDVYAYDCVLDGTRVGLSFKTRRPRGGGGENLYMERIRIKTPGSAIKFDMLGSAKYVGGQSARNAMLRNELTPYYRNVNIRDIIVEQAKTFLNITGIPESPANNININNVKSTTQQLMTLHDVSNLLLRNADLTTTEGNKIEISDGRNITFDNVTIHTPNGKVDVEKSGSLTENLRL